MYWTIYPHYNSSTFSSPVIMSDAAWSSSSPPFTWCITVILKGRRTMLQKAQLFSIALQRHAPMRGTGCMWHTNCICSPHHHTHRCFPETAAVCHHSAPTRPLDIGFTALLGIAIAIFWSIYLIFCKGNAHCVLLPGDQQFQLISFPTCFHYVTEWKAHL